MAITQGYRSQTLAGWETDIHGVLADPDYYKVPFMTNSLSFTQALNDSAVLTGIRSTTKPFFGNRTAEGSLDVPFDADISGFFFKGLCGNAESSTATDAVTNEISAWTATTNYKVGDIVKDSVGGVTDTYFVCTVAGTSGATEPTWASGAGTEYTDGTVTWISSQDNYHKFYVSTTQLPYMFVEKAFPDINEYIVYRGCKVNTMSLSVGGDGEMMASMNMMGVRADDPSATSIGDGTGTSTDLTTNRFQFQNFKADLSSSVMTNDEVAAVQDVSLEFSNSLQGNIYTINSRGSRREIPEGLMNISGTINALFEGTTLMQKANDGTELDMTFSFVEEEHVCRITLPEARIEPFDPSVDGPEGLTASISFRAYRDNDTQSPITIILTNSVASYA